MKTHNKLLALLLIVMMLTSLTSGCKPRDNKDGGESSSSTPTSQSAGQTTISEGKTVANAIPNMLDHVAEMEAINSDTVGWLQIPELAIDDVVVCNDDPSDQNKFYHRRNFNKEEEFNGVLYADFRSTFGDGSAAQLGTNTCVYGHAMTDEKDNPKYNIFFGPLHDLRDPDIAKKVPYIFFSTEKENLAFEVFAVFVANADNTVVPYNRNDIPQEEFVKMVKEQVLPRSLYDYGVEIKDDDKFLTLSTCIYTLPNGTATGYPNTFMRYAVMGRLVRADEPLKTEVGLKTNENPIIDPDGKVKK